jgi:hypothetical protein
MNPGIQAAYRATHSVIPQENDQDGFLGRDASPSAAYLAKRIKNVYTAI